MNRRVGQDLNTQHEIGDGNAALTVSDDRLVLRSTRDSTQRVVVSSGLLSLDNATLSGAIANRRALFVVSPTVDQLYGDELRRYIDSSLDCAGSELFVLNVAESTKSLDGVAAVAARASEMGLEREGPMVAVGGGVCLDVVALSAALYRRGVPNIKIPTTLVGLIDAGVGTKNAVNFRGHKNLLGTFSSPEASLLDARFLTTLPDRHLRTGVAEMLKLAIIGDRTLFNVLETHKSELQRNRFQSPQPEASEAIRCSVTGILRELSLNLHEKSRRRILDFGHTFSPYIESASKFQVLHGEAVAIDIAISSQIATSLGILDSKVCEAILDALAGFELPRYWAGIDAAAMYNSLRSIRQHRDGELHLVVPSEIGQPVFLEDEDIDQTLLESCLIRLRRDS